MNRLFFAALGILILAGCAHNKVSTSPDYMNSEDNKHKSQLKASLFSGAAALNDQQVQNLLTSKIILPKKPKLVIIRLSPSQYSYDIYYRNEQSFNSKAFSLNEINTQGFIKILTDSKIFSDVSILPNFMIMNESNFEILRTAALRAQADLALITKTETFTDWQFNFSTSNHAKALATVESIIIDTRTGTVPFSSITSEIATENKREEDYGMNDTMNRAKSVAEGAALNKTSEDFVNFLKLIR
jgi:uncharacterized ubiquitin-like protein YukD